MKIIFFRDLTNFEVVVDVLQKFESGTASEGKSFEILVSMGLNEYEHIDFETSAIRHSNTFVSYR